MVKTDGGLRFNLNVSVKGEENNIHLRLEPEMKAFLGTSNVKTPCSGPIEALVACLRSYSFISRSLNGFPSKKLLSCKGEAWLNVWKKGREKRCLQKAAAPQQACGCWRMRPAQLNVSSLESPSHFLTQKHEGKNVQKCERNIYERQIHNLKGEAEGGGEKSSANNGDAHICCNAVLRSFFSSFANHLFLHRNMKFFCCFFLKKRSKLKTTKNKM